MEGEDSKKLLSEGEYFDISDYGLVWLIKEPRKMRTSTKSNISNENIN